MDSVRNQPDDDSDDATAAFAVAESSESFVHTAVAADDDDLLPNPDPGSPTASTGVAARIEASVSLAVVQHETTATTSPPIGDPGAVTENPNPNAPPATSVPAVVPPILPVQHPTVTDEGDFYFYYRSQRLARMTHTTTFPHPMLTAIKGEPTFDSLRTLTQELEANAMSVASRLGGGQHGHLALLHDAASYALISGTQPWILPPNPALITLADLTAINAPPAWYLFFLYDEAKEVRSTAFAVKNALHRQIIVAVPELYMNAYAALHGGIGMCSALEILTYLKKTYGKKTITPIITTTTTTEPHAKSSHRRSNGGTVISDGLQKVTVHYCWSCGIHNVNHKQAHPSKRCTNPRPGHNKTSTLLDRKGGSNQFLAGRA